MDIIFDICGVILEWNPDQIIEHYFKDPDVKKSVKNEIFIIQIGRN